MPERFDLTYTDPTTSQQRPVMIHRALLGSMERFAGILIEHYGGRFPVWLAPVQATVLPISDRHVEFGAAVAAAAARARACGSRSTAARSRSARRSATPNSAADPYMLVVGDREEESGRGRGPLPRGGRARGRWTLAEFAELVARAPSRPAEPCGARDAALSLYFGALDRRHAKHTAPLSVPWPPPHPSSS